MTDAATAPTAAQLADAYIRAQALGLTIKGRKKYRLLEGEDVHECGDFDGLMSVLSWRERIARGEPTYLVSPCGAYRTEFMNDAAGTHFYAEHQGDGVYKRINGGKTDPETGETSSFDVLEDGSHKETYRAGVFCS